MGCRVEVVKDGEKRAKEPEGTRLVGSELKVEQACQEFVCPVCYSAQGVYCSYGKDRQGRVRLGYAHTGRYRLAIQAGTVPPFAGGR